MIGGNLVVCATCGKNKMPDPDGLYCLFCHASEFRKVHLHKLEIPKHLEIPE